RIPRRPARGRAGSGARRGLQAHRGEGGPFLMLIFDILSITLIMTGALFSLGASIGLIRFRDTVARMHASTKPQTLGLTLTLLSVVAHIVARGGGGVTVAGDMGMMVLVVLFAMITSPIIGNRLGHVS